MSYCHCCRGTVEKLTDDWNSERDLSLQDDLSADRGCVANEPAR